MKTAKKMFKKLGLSYSKDGYQIHYYNDNDDRYIWFYLDTETIEITFDIDIKHLQAVNQQVKELGWDEQ